MVLFNVTYSVVTPESAEDGEADECGFIDRGMTLRDAIKATQDTRTNRVGGVECTEPSCYPISTPCWITVINSMEFETGASESRSLHIPGSVTTASARRIARLLGANIR
jgi:hypothetical protein